jgi:hypothetical protein
MNDVFSLISSDSIGSFHEHPMTAFKKPSSCTSSPFSPRLIIAREACGSENAAKRSTSVCYNMFKYTICRKHAKCFSVLKKVLKSRYK